MFDQDKIYTASSPLVHRQVPRAHGRGRRRRPVVDPRPAAAARARAARVRGVGHRARQRHHPNGSMPGRGQVAARLPAHKRRVAFAIDRPRRDLLALTRHEAGPAQARRTICACMHICNVMRE